MNERRLREALRRTAPPDTAGARERARAVSRSGYEQRQRRATRPRPFGPPATAAIAALLVALAVAFTPPGDAVADWVRDLVRGTTDPPRPRPALARLPGEGRLLVSGAGGAWIVHPDGSRRRLGAYREATWSPGGLFVAATRGHDLVAVDPRGTIRWVLSRPDAVHDPRWSPSGFRVAYRSGESLRVVYGDGSNDALVAHRVSAVAAAWRPADHHVLSYVNRAGRIVVRDLTTRRILGSLHAGLAVQRLEWSADGSHLLVTGSRGIRVLNGSDRVVSRLDAPAGTSFVDAALSPRGGRVAIVARRRSDGRHDVLIASATAAVTRPRSAFRAKGAIRSITWSPDRQIVLADWTASDQWLFLSAGRGGAASAVAGIAAHFDPGRAHPRREVRIQGWCCS